MTSITLSNVSKRFGAKVAIPGIDLDVADGEFLVLLGPSGCGKSTLLRMLAGLETVSGGEIHLGGRRVDQLPPSGRDMAFVFQSYALYPHLTVRRNIAFPLVMRQFRWWFHVPLLGSLAKRRIERSPEVVDLVARTARTLSLTEMLDRHPRTLSGGQRQRVALGRAMVRQPQVFLMDEPLSNLDAKLRTAMRGEITRLHGRVGGTFVYVTHDQVEAMTMGTRIALMRDGMIQQLGTPKEIYTDPANTYVARFIGAPAMNLIRADAGAGAVRTGGLTLALPPNLPRLAPGGPVLVGVRASTMTLREPGSADTVPGTVSLVEHIGDESVVAVRLEGVQTAHDEEGEVSGEIMVTVPGYSGLHQGDAVGVAFDLSEAVLFSPETGQRLRVQN